jgi:hypothetical protein
VGNAGEPRNLSGHRVDCSGAVAKLTIRVRAPGLNGAVRNHNDGVVRAGGQRIRLRRGTGAREQHSDRERSIEVTHGHTTPFHTIPVFRTGSDPSVEWLWRCQLIKRAQGKRPMIADEVASVNAAR